MSTLTPSACELGPEPTEYHDTEPTTALYRARYRRDVGVGSHPMLGHVTVHIDRKPRLEHCGPDGMRVSLSREDGTEMFPHHLGVRRLLRVAERARWRHPHLCCRLMTYASHHMQPVRQHERLAPTSDGIVPVPSPMPDAWTEADEEGYYAALRVLQRGEHASRATSPYGLSTIPTAHPDGAPLPDTPTGPQGHGDTEELARIAKAGADIARRIATQRRERSLAGDQDAELRQLRLAFHDLEQVSETRLHCMQRSAQQLYELRELLGDARRVLVRDKLRGSLNDCLIELYADRVKHAEAELATVTNDHARNLKGRREDRERHAAEMRRKDRAFLGWVILTSIGVPLGVIAARVIGLF